MGAWRVSQTDASWDICRGNWCCEVSPPMPSKCVHVCACVCVCVITAVFKLQDSSSTGLPVFRSPSSSLLPLSFFLDPSSLVLLPPFRRYDLRIASVNEVGIGPFSDTLVAVSTLGPPTISPRAPTLASNQPPGAPPTAGIGFLNLAWEAGGRATVPGATDAPLTGYILKCYLSLAN